MKRIRVLIADDHPVVRAGLQGMLASQPDFELVGEAATGKEAVMLAGSLASGCSADGPANGRNGRSGSHSANSISATQNPCTSSDNL